MRIQNTYDLDIYIDGFNIFEASGVIFLSACILEGIANPIPTCSLKLSVPTAWMNQRAIVDGTKIRFDIKAEAYNLSESLYFRLFNINKLSLNQQFVTLDLSGVLDFHEGYRKANALNLYGNSSDVFSNIARTFNLANDIDPTNDRQLWVAGENNLYQYLMNTAMYGWSNDTSCMFWCIDRHKILLYKNLTTLLRTRSNKPWQFIKSATPNIKDKQYGYTDAYVYIASGYENLTNEGYGGTDDYFDLISYSWKEAKSNKIIAESSLINISKELSQGLANNYYPFDVGNFHKNYWIAKKQNKRIASTYSTYVEIRSQFLMNYRLGQVVNFDLMDSCGINNKINCCSGVFIIDSIEINLSQKAVTCNLELMMQGLNSTAKRETY